MSMSKEYYHEYLSRADEVPKLMRDCGLFSLKVRFEGTDINKGIVDRVLTFYHDGTVSVDESKEIPIVALDRLLEATFAYNRRPTSLDEVPTAAMHRLSEALFEVEKECKKRGA